MTPHYPTPQELGIRIPTHLRETRFMHGFEHALKGGHLTRAEYFRLSFREGYRTGKLFLRELRRSRGILEFPMKAHVHIRMVH